MTATPETSPPVDSRRVAWLVAGNDEPACRALGEVDPAPAAVRYAFEVAARATQHVGLIRVPLACERRLPNGLPSIGDRHADGHASTATIAGWFEKVLRHGLSSRSS